MAKKALLIAACILLSACAPRAAQSVTETVPAAAISPSLSAVSTTPELSGTTPVDLTPTRQPTIAFTASAPADCQVVPVVPTIDTLTQHNVPAEASYDHAYGAESPGVTILSYCSYQNPTCRTLNANLAEIQQRYSNSVRVILRQYPRPDVENKSLLAAYAAEAAALEDHYWEMNNLLYTQQSDWLDLSPDEFQTWLTVQAESMGISDAQWKAALGDERVIAAIDQTLQDAAGLQIQSTPVLFYNHIIVKSAVDVDSLTVLLDYFLLPEKAYSACPPQVVDPSKSYSAIFKTEKGEIIFDLFPQIAPLSVNNFVFLAREGWYNHTSFFRVIPGFVAQGGDPSNSGLGTPGYGIELEVDPAYRFDALGLLALSHDSAGLSGSQFFITYSALPEMDGQFTIIGRIRSGMDVLNSFRPRNPESDEILLPAEALISVTIKEE